MIYKSFNKIPYMSNIWNKKDVLHVKYMKMFSITWIPWNLSFRYIHPGGPFSSKMATNAEQSFAFIFGVNWLCHCGVTPSFGVFLHEIKCNGMTNFIEFMMIYTYK